MFGGSVVECLERLGRGHTRPGPRGCPELISRALFMTRMRLFENIEYEANNFDFALGTPGLHTVRRRAEWIERETVLPPDLFARFVNDAFWRTDETAQRRVRRIHV